MKFNFFKKDKKKTPIPKSTHNMFKEEKPKEHKRKTFKFFSKKIYNKTYDIVKKDKFWVKNIIYIVSPIFLFLILFVFSRTSYFNISFVSVERQDPYVNIDLSYKVLNDYIYKNIFSFDKKEYEKDLKYFQPNIKKIEIIKNYPSTLKTKLYSYEPVFQTIIDDKSYVILENWVFVPYKINDEDNLPIINIHNLKLWFSSSFSYSEVIKQDDLDKIRYLIKWVKILDENIKIDEINYFVLNKEIHVKSWNTLYLFDLVWDLNDELFSFEIFYDNTFSWEETYVDFRIKDRYDICPRTPGQYESITKLKEDCGKILEKIYDYNF